MAFEKETWPEGSSKVGDMSDFSKIYPQNIKKNLYRASLFVLGFEVMRDIIVDNVKSWLSLNQEEYGAKIGRKHVFEKSCNWLVENGALTSTQAADIQLLRKKRDAIVHEMLDFLVDPERTLRAPDLEKIGLYISTISKWWAKLRAECDPAFDHIQISQADITSPLSDLFQYFLTLTHDIDETFNG